MGVKLSATAEQILQNAVDSVGDSTDPVTTKAVLGHPSDQVGRTTRWPVGGSFRSMIGVGC
jgi:hypothetical protein